MTQRKLSQEAERKVEGGCEDDQVAALPNAWRDDELEIARLAKALLDERKPDQKDGDDQRIEDIPLCCSAFDHTFSPMFFPRMPAGLMISTTMRMRNTNASAMLELT
ncbi:hypothetical protein SDC9_136416 [bioreactor metagenome]|uniref:Uncharacterized protein n=1 Tax=bioreactor metagenome TaxID=1076179 RepID=A0A645DJ69_9ZZZZ